MKPQGIQTTGSAGEKGALENPALTKEFKVKNFKRIVLCHIQNKASLWANFSPQAACIPWFEGASGGGQMGRASTQSMLCI